MNVSYDILQKFVSPPKKFTARELAETLTMSVVEVDAWEDQAERLAGVVIGLVTGIEAHPKADKLKLAQVDCGAEQFLVVCGGVNLRVGMKVAFARVGARVRWHGQGDWVQLTAAKIRGVESNGMICAAEELELYDPVAQEHGIMDLSHLPAQPGRPLSEALGMSDVILEIDNKSITHRPDLWGHLGVARELAALWRVPLHQPSLPELKPEIDVPLMVSSKAGDGLVRYLGVAMGGIKIGASPAWLQQALVSLGFRPINNIVDATNYCMAEFGQPLHAFDVDKLASPEIVVRYAKRGEKLAMLDGVTRSLDADTLVIADRKRALAVAGVMGGQMSGVTEATTSIVLESANFEPVGIRLTAARLGLRTEASARFEKALDPELAELAMRRAVALIQEVCPGARVVSPVVDVFPKVPNQRIITLSLPWLYQRLGCEVSAREVLDILSRLGFKAQEKSGELVVTVPSWRATRDITIPEDLVEEVARIYSYGKIPLSMPKFDIAPPAIDEAREIRWKIRELLAGAGWTETLSYSFVGQGSLELDNPIDQTRRFLRSNLVASFGPQFTVACRAGGGSVRLFELGRVFRDSTGNWPDSIKGAHNLPSQPWHFVLAANVPGSDSLRVVKGVLEFLERELKIKFTVEFSQADGLGAMAEVELEALSLEAGRVYEQLPRYPSVTRDLSVVVPPGVAWAAVESAVRSTSPLITSIEVFDVYADKGSVAFHVTFRSPERTLTSQEVDTIMTSLTNVLRQQFGVTIRS